MTNVALTVLSAPDPAYGEGVGVVDLHPEAQVRQPKDKQVVGDYLVLLAEVVSVPRGRSGLGPRTRTICWQTGCGCEDASERATASSPARRPRV